MKKKINRKHIAVLLTMGVTIWGTACSYQAENNEVETVNEVQQCEEVPEPTTNVELNEEVEETKSVDQEEEVLLEEQAPPQILRFIDAWEEWHEVQVNPEIPKHSYDFSLLHNTENSITYEGDDNYYIRKGIDVSYHQGKIDWEKVRNDGIEFAFIRIGYRGYGKQGSLMVDGEFEQNIMNARNAGLDVGVYIFSQAINEQEALEEAMLVIEELKRVNVELQLPVVYDPELIRDDVARTDNVSGEQFTKNTIAFCEKIKEAGYEPMIYSNMVWEAYYFDLMQLTEYPIWYADYENIPQTPYWFSFWQYACDGEVDGISGRVDMNIQFVNKGGAEEK